MTKNSSAQIPFEVGTRDEQMYAQLKKIAASYMRRERASHTLQATALVHEALLQLGKKNEARWNDRVHFLASAAQMMRWILLDYAKARNREKRGGGDLRVTFNEALHADSKDMDLVALNDALTLLEKENARLAKVVELRFFGGSSIEEAAEVLGISPATVKRDWLLAKAWLFRQLSNTEGKGE